METGYYGTFVISWSQTEVDTLANPDISLVVTGATWRWNGEAVQVDASGQVLRLGGAIGAATLHQRAARMVRKLVGAAIDPRPETKRHVFEDRPDETSVPQPEFILTDGRQTYRATIIPVPQSAARLVMFVGQLPPSGQDLWIVRAALDPRRIDATPRAEGGVICFAAGTLIDTPRGSRPIEMLKPGDMVWTADNGAQEILWTGQRRMSGARLYAMPHLRPIRIRVGALGDGAPEEDLLVSPEHRVLICGAAARDLFGTPEVLVRASDLVDELRVTQAPGLMEITYVHLLLPAHEVIFANGALAESFHPQSAALETIESSQRAALLEVLPDAQDNPQSYGAYARRLLNRSEAAILRHAAA
jgi:hypothetical protein